jgi:hypothetical protein
MAALFFPPTSATAAEGISVRPQLCRITRRLLGKGRTAVLKNSVADEWLILSKEKTMPRFPSTAPIGFQSTIKPFFTACYRAHMLDIMSLDLWDASAVQSNWDDINTAVSNGSMPKTGCPEGVWDEGTKTLFLSDFLAWKNWGYPP